MACSAPTHGWSDNIKRIFTTFSSSTSNFDKARNPRLTIHPSGIVWRTVLAQSIFSDMSLGISGGKRFLRLHHLGLSGVILYELPDARGHVDPLEHEDRGEFTMKSVFGDISDPEDLGMGVGELLDRVRARLIYVPGYTCTSFVTGQVMNGLIYSHTMYPKSSPSGFVVESTAFDACECVKSTKTYATKPVIDVSAYLRTRTLTSDQLLSLPKAVVLDFSDDEEFEQDETFDTSISTIDSFGPCTPPPSRCGSPANLVPLDYPTLPSPLCEILGNTTPLCVLSPSIDFFEFVSPILTSSDCKANHAHVNSSPDKEEDKENRASDPKKLPTFYHHLDIARMEAEQTVG